MYLYYQGKKETHCRTLTIVLLLPIFFYIKFEKPLFVSKGADFLLSSFFRRC